MRNSLPSAGSCPDCERANQILSDVVFNNAELVTAMVHAVGPVLLLEGTPEIRGEIRGRLKEFFEGFFEDEGEKYSHNKPYESLTHTFLHMAVSVISYREIGDTLYGKAQEGAYDSLLK